MDSPGKHGVSGAEANHADTTVMSESTASHREQAATDEKARSVICAVLTVSDSRSHSTDKSGREIEDLLAKAGHESVARRVIPDEPDVIEAQLEDWLTETRIQVVLTTGGTGISHRDSTIEVARQLITAELEGFGELFRAISFESIGPAAMLSRAVGGLTSREPSAGGDTFMFCMPGSTDAVQTAMTRLILPELPHLIWQRSL